jgi:DNA-binding response OmpR family regulator
VSAEKVTVKGGLVCRPGRSGTTRPPPGWARRDQRLLVIASRGKKLGKPLDEIVRFGPFVPHSRGRVLPPDDSPVELGSRTLDILCLLVKRSRELVSKEELLD